MAFKKNNLLFNVFMYITIIAHLFMKNNMAKEKNTLLFLLLIEVKQAATAWSQLLLE